MEVVCPTIMRSRIDSLTTSAPGRRALTDLRLVSGRRRHGCVAVAVVEQAAGSCSGIRGSQRQMAEFERRGFSLVADAAAHDQIAQVHHFAVHCVFPGQGLGDLVGPFEPDGTVGRFKAGVDGEAVGQAGV